MINLKRVGPNVGESLRWTAVCAMVLVGLTWGDGGMVAMAQPAVATAPGTMGPPAEVGGDDLLTFDGVRLSATFYPGTASKETIPILFLHDWKGSRADFEPLVKHLEPYGYAMLVPDLRGHGDSTTRLVRNMRTGRIDETSLDAAQFRPADLQALAREDLRALRRFLVAKNNEGKLNLNKLVVVAAGSSANIAMEWTIYDWLVPNYPHAGIKQGKDVKGLVLLSPLWTLVGFNTPTAAQHRVLRSDVSSMVAAGRLDPRRFSDAEKVVKAMRDDRSSRAAEAAAETSRIWFGRFETAEQGANLLKDESLEVPSHVERFLQLRVQQAYPDAVWIEHREP